jgi:hypothetical protein
MGLILVKPTPMYMIELYTYKEVSISSINPKLPNFQIQNMGLGVVYEPKFIKANKIWN